VQMCTELGAAEVIPWQSERSIARWVGDKKVKGRVRWAAIAREASKQAMRSSIPSVADIVTTAELARMAGERRSSCSTRVPVFRSGIGPDRTRTSAKSWSSLARRAAFRRTKLTHYWRGVHTQSTPAQRSCAPQPRVPWVFPRFEPFSVSCDAVRLN
jgi:hypothetical protein